MNIFALDADTKKCAQYHVDKHVSKLIVEQLQVLCTAKRVLDGIDGDHPILYKVTHRNHPSAIYCRKNADSFLWVVEMTYELQKEYTHRYGKVHLCERKGMLDWLVENMPTKWEAPNEEFDYPTPAMPDDCKVYNNGKIDVIASYRKYYIQGKQHLHSWKNRSIPDWI